MALTQRPTWASHALDAGPDGPPPGLPAPPPHRSPASPAAQGLVALAVVIAFAGLGLRVGSTPWFALPTIALLIGVAIGVQPDARRWFPVVPGVAWALGTFVVLSVLWVLMATSADVLLTFAPVPLIALVVFGADWAWVERLRPTVVTSGLGLIPLLDVIAKDERVVSAKPIIASDMPCAWISIVNDNRIADDAREFGLLGAADILGFENPHLAYPEGDDVSGQPVDEDSELDAGDLDGVEVLKED